MNRSQKITTGMSAVGTILLCLVGLAVCGLILAFVIAVANS